MGRIMPPGALVVCAAIAGALLGFSLTEARAQNRPAPAQSPSKSANEDAGHKSIPPIYNPYPPGILPSDLESEIARVRREVRGIFNQGVNEWRALPAPILRDNPP